LEYKYLPCEKLQDVQVEGGRINELEVLVGRPMAVRSPQWIWCLSSEESAKLGATVSNQIFSNRIRIPEWRWLSLQGHCDRGPWTSGFPEYTIVINDIHLPWAYANAVLLRWTEPDSFRAWIKVPGAACMEPDKRAEWAADIARQLSRRLAPAKWSLDSQSWLLCPHSPVFKANAHEENVPSWKNWDWIAPETIARLDLSSRLEKEGQAFHRLIHWRNEQIKKQGVRRDHAVHAP
jgi:hypothetical protein